MIAIIDSSALVSLINADDAIHAEALSVREQINARSCELLLPYEVLAETLNVFGRKMGKGYAVRAGQTLLDMHLNGQIRLTTSEPDVLLRALARQAHATGSPSFVDCLVMAYADVRGTDCIFGFDAAFRKNGYRLPGTSPTPAAA